MTLLKYANFIATELEEGISAGATELIVPLAVTEALPTLGVDEEIRLVLWDGQQAPEIVSVTDNPQTGVLTVTRGEESTTAKAWEAGTQVRCTLTAELVNLLATTLFDIDAALLLAFLPLAGGTLTGPLILAADPSAGLGAATKSYADTIGAGKLSTTGGTMSGSINMDSNSIFGLPTPVADSQAASKEYVDGLSGSGDALRADDSAGLVAAGTAAAYTLNTTEGYLALADGITLTIKFPVTNTAGPTLAIDSLSAKGIVSVIGETLPGGFLEPLVPYRLTYDLSDDKWILHSAYRMPEVLLESGILASVTGKSFSFTPYTGFRKFRVIFTSMRPATDGASLRVLTSSNAGVSFDTGASDYKYTSSADDNATNNPYGQSSGGTTELRLSLDTGNATTKGLNMEIEIHDPLNTALHTQISWVGGGISAAGAAWCIQGSGQRQAAADIDSVLFSFTSGNIAAAKYALIGVR
jgi:hypothetical protein